MNTSVIRHFLLRFFILITGLFFYALGIVITIKANIGYAPWDVFHIGLVKRTGLSLGHISMLIGLLIIILIVILKEKIGIGTIFNMILIGLFIDIIFPVIPVAANPVIGTLMLISGLFVIAVGTYFYIKSAFGAGPRDNLMVVLAKRTKLPVGLCRGIIELSVMIIGWIMGGMVGFGTVISVVAIGFCVHLVLKLFRFDVTT
ncbi:MAG: hypothetical protein FWF22_07045, partial [Treponema sp.]|nr:hypothetical protein [Treponema sp.]